MFVLVSDRLKSNIVDDLGLHGLYVIHEELNELSDITCTREYSELSSWYSLNSLVLQRIYSAYCQLSVRDVDISRITVYASISRGDTIGGTSPRIPVQHTATHISSGSDRMVLAFISEITDERVFEDIRGRCLTGVPSPPGIDETWHPSTRWDGKSPSEYHLIVAERLFVLATSKTCADTLAMALRLSL